MNKENLEKLVEFYEKKLDELTELVEGLIDTSRIGKLTTSELDRQLDKNWKKKDARGYLGGHCRNAKGKLEYEKVVETLAHYQGIILGMQYILSCFGIHKELELGDMTNIVERGDGQRLVKDDGSKIYFGAGLNGK